MRSSAFSLLAAAAAAGLAAGAILLAGCGSVPAAGVASAASAGATKAVAASGVVPWIASPPPPMTLPTPVPAKPLPTSAPPCDPLDLRATEFGTTALAGSLDIFFKITNVGPATCLVRGRPRSITLISSSGQELPLAITPGDGLTGTLEPSDTAPGAFAELVVNAPVGGPCPPGESALTVPGSLSAVRIGLPDGNSVTAAVTAGASAPRVVFACSAVQVSDFGVEPPPPVYPAEPMPALKATLSLPATVRAGQDLRYVVALINPTAKPIALAPCPGYLESLMTRSATASPGKSGGDAAASLSGQTAYKTAYRLNCGPVGSIPAHGTVRFAMVLPVPVTFAPGPARASWALEPPFESAVRSGDVQILPPAR